MSALRLIMCVMLCELRYAVPKSSAHGADNTQALQRGKKCLV
jgi:hypothetical protein